MADMKISPSRRIDVAAGEERAVSVDHVTRELSRVWSDISREVQERSGQIPLRTSILTLMVVARGKSEMRVAHDTLHELVEQLPSRAIVIEIGPAGGRLDASIAAHCRYLETGRATCYEVIELRAPADHLDALPSLVVPLELFDVPSFMWWVGGFDFKSLDFQRLTSSAERIIIDSSRFDSALDALADYAYFLRHEDTACTGTDLNWARATSWRELIAQSFDHPEAQGLLPDIQRVEISFDPSAEAQALLLIGWLATRLNWTLDDATHENQTTRLSLDNPRGAHVSVNLNRHASAGIGLRAVRVLAGSRTKTARITIRKQSEQLAVVATETAGRPRQERVLRDPRPRLSDLVGKELLIHTQDHVFAESLDFVADVVETLRRPRFNA